MGDLRESYDNARLKLRFCQLYYYLYKAYYESKSNPTSNLDKARKFKEQWVQNNKGNTYYIIVYHIKEHN